MSPPTWAYQIDAFDPPPDEELVCSVCHCVFCDPVHSSCNHVFCRICISKWLEMNRNCPICRKRTSLYSLQEVVPLIRNMINKLTLRCHNLEKGCVEKFTLEACETHIKQCLYEWVKCKNKPCKQMVLRKDMNDHELYDCSHRYVKCKKCGLKISLMLPQQHNCVRELKQCLQEKMQIIKKKKQKIKELQSEIKTLKEEDSQHSETSSMDSIGAAAVMMNLNDLSSLSSGSSISSTSFVSTSENDPMSFLQNTSQILQRFLMSSEDPDADNSTEYPRASSPYPSSRSSAGRSDNPVVATVDVLTSAESPVRRPPKRRLPAALLDTSDEDEELRELPSLPSPKRVWRLHREDGGETSQGMYMNLTSEEGPPGSSAFDFAGTSSSWVATPPFATTPSFAATSDPLPSLSVRARLRRARQRPIMSPRPEVESAASSSRSGGLERTIAMLSTSNLESDPEWLPDEQPDQLVNCSMDYPALDVGEVYTLSSESSDSDSSSSDSDSESGSEEPDLLSRISIYSCSDDDDDPDFQPIEDF